MYIEEIQRKYKEYFKDIDDRGYELLWTVFYYEIQKIKQENNNIFGKNPLPPIDTIKADYFLFLKNHDLNYYIQVSHLTVKNRILPKEYISWVSKTDYLLIFWLIQKLKPISLPQENHIKIEDKEIYSNILPQKNTNTRATPPLIPQVGIFINQGFMKTTSSLYDNFIYELDKLNLDLKEKNDLIEQLKIEWHKTKKNDTLEKWIDKKNTEQLNWICEYLNKKEIKKTCPNLELIGWETNSDQYSSILFKLSEFSFDHSDSRKLYIDKMKRSWSQKKFRDGEKTKKPYHLPLTKESIRQLQQLSRLMNMKEQKIIETLIDEKFHNVATKDGKYLY
ncbi:hypothetical protein NDN11_04720 [Acinetobacter sp. C26M]|uniref:hypothetical protein n=1 Tax=unclassified Acinetobacter TaxID=196816 RepID=UPI0020369F3B|nr:MULTISPECIES: hypothetical protein [unclassified Acinetobacter]USA47423.1 hypothetical protein NDN11_04720 [Acinetobacter sp. C26M]USA50904.1 hypothetical protein NDN12_04720 [Acinetobacter sp. C26G]